MGRLSKTWIRIPPPPQFFPTPPQIFLHSCQKKKLSYIYIIQIKTIFSLMKNIAIALFSVVLLTACVTEATEPTVEETVVDSTIVEETVEEVTFEEELTIAE